jgi:hypothetical protein
MRITDLRKRISRKERRVMAGNTDRRTSPNSRKALDAMSAAAVIRRM